MRTKKVGGFDPDDEDLKMIFKIIFKIINTQSVQAQDEKIVKLHQILNQIWERKSIWKKKLKRIKNLYCRELNREKRDKCGKIIEVLEILTPGQITHVQSNSRNQSRSNRRSSAHTRRRRSNQGEHSPLMSNLEEF